MILPVLTLALDGAALLLPSLPFGADVRTLLMAIAGQEGAWAYRTQINGPARSYWQIEVEAIAQAFHAGELLQGAAQAIDIAPTVAGIYAALPFCDVLAACVARLILWPDPEPIPAVGDAAGAWSYYLRCWRPGKPGPGRWQAVYAVAAKAVAAPHAATEAAAVA